MQRFDVTRLSADKAYKLHATSYPDRRAMNIWSKMYHFYMYNCAESWGTISSAVQRRDDVQHD
jgi:hypothetical protein